MASTAVPALDNEYRILVPQPTRGLFPAAIAVTRVAVLDEGDGPGTRRLQIRRDPRNELLQWNSAFDDQPAISEVFPIAQRNLGGAEPGPTPIAAAERALQARIGLVYAMNELTEREAEMIGLLYDTSTALPLAAVHAKETSPPPPPDEEEEPPVDLWTHDAGALVRARFGQIVYACLRDLILHDEAAPIEAPTGWIPVLPIRPIAWPPYLPLPDELPMSALPSGG